jgi:hypothetical protein
MTKAGLPEAELPSPPSPGVARLFLNGGIFLVCGILAAMAIRAKLPFPVDLGVIGPKYQYFAAHRDDFDVLFIGSSRFYHGIIPQQFDGAVAQAAGRSLTSFNIAYDAMWPPESFYFLRQVLALHPNRLRWVVIELMNVDPRVQKEPSDRDAYWHDLHETRQAEAAIPDWTSLEDVERRKYTHKQQSFALQFAKERWLRTHRELLLEQWANLGRGARVIVPVLEPSRPREEEWIKTNGYRPEPEGGLKGKELEDFTGKLQEIEKQLNRVKMRPVLAAAVEEISAAVRAAHAEPIFVISPTINTYENLITPADLSVLRFNDPRKYPELFDPALFFDEFHLNPSGAVKFTDALGRSFAAQVGPALGNPEAGR